MQYNNTRDGHPTPRKNTRVESYIMNTNTNNDRAARLAADLKAHRAAKHANATETTPAHYIAAVTTCAKYAADLADSDSHKAANTARKANAAANKARRAAAIATADTTTPADRADALTIAAVDAMRRAADTTANAAAIADIAADLANDPAAALIILDTTAPDIQTARRDITTRADALTCRGIIPPYISIRIYRDITDPAELMTAAADIARRTAKNAVCREGTPKQWTIYNAAAAREYDPDLADMQAAAALALSVCANATAADADHMTAAADNIADTPRADLADMTARDVREIRRAADLADIIRARLAASPDWICAAYHAAYTAVNDHLTDCRAIRTTEHPAPLSIDEIDPDNTILADAADSEDADRAAAIGGALKRAYMALTPTRRAIWTRRAKGYTLRDIAADMHRDRKTIAEHMHGIRKQAAAAMAERCPDIAAAVLTADIMAETDATAAAALAAREKAANTAAALNMLDTTPARKQAAQERAANAATAADRATAAADLAARAACVLSAAVAGLTPTRRIIWQKLANGESVKHIAETMHRDRKTTREHITAIRRILSAAVRDTSPDLSSALTAADLADVARALTK